MKACRDSIPGQDMCALQRPEAVEFGHFDRCGHGRVQLNAHACGRGLGGLDPITFGMDDRHQIRRLLMHLRGEQPKVVEHHLKTGFDLLDAAFPDQDDLPTFGESIAHDRPLFEGGVGGLEHAVPPGQSHTVRSGV